MREKGTKTEPPFVKMFLTLTKKVIQDFRMKKINREVDLLFYIINQMIHEDLSSTEVYLRPEEVAKNLNRSPQTIRQWIRTLMKEGYLLRHPRIRGKHWYVFNPYYLYRGQQEFNDQLWIEALHLYQSQPECSTS